MEEMKESMEPTLLYEAAGLVKSHAMRDVLAQAGAGQVDEDEFHDSVQVYETACDLELMAELDLEDGDSKMADRVFGQILPARQFLGDGAGEQAMACHLLYAAATAASKERTEGGPEGGQGWVEILEKSLISPVVAEKAWAAIRDDMARNGGVSMEFFGEGGQGEPHGPRELSMTFDRQDLADWGVDVRKVADADGLCAEWADMMHDELVDKSNLPYVALERALKNKGYDPDEVFEADVRPAVLKKSYLPAQAIDLNEEDLVTQGVDLSKVPDPAAAVRAWKEAVVDRVYEDGDLRRNTLFDALSKMGLDSAGVMAGPAVSENTRLAAPAGAQGRWTGALEAFDVTAQARVTGRASGVYADMDSGLIWADTAHSIPDLPKYDDPRIVQVQHYDVGDVVEPPSELEAFAQEAFEAFEANGGAPGYTLTPGQVAGIEEAIKTVYGSWKSALGRAPFSISAQRGAAARAVERDEEDRARGVDPVEGREGDGGRFEIGGQK